MSLPIKSDAIEVVSGGAANPKVVAGTADPAVGFSAPEGSIYLRYGVGVGKAYVKSGVGDTNWGEVDAGGGGIGGTLDDAYDFGSPGGGRIIAADSGAVRIDAGTNDTQAALHIQRLPGGASAAVGIDLVLSSSVNAMGAGIQITDPGSGTSLKVTKSAAGSVYFADLTNAGAKALEVVVTAAPTSVSPVSIVANTTGTTAALLSISKIPGGATAGVGFSVSMGANASGSGVYVSHAGSGPAIEVVGGIQVANSSLGVSPANTGRIRYNSGTQKFEMSLNGAAYSNLGNAAIGAEVTGATAGSVLFAGAAGVLAQDNTSFFWNDTNNVLQLTTNHATTGPLNITATTNTAPSAIAFFNHGSAFQGYMGWFNNLYGGFPYMQDKFGLLAIGGAPFVLGSQFVAAHEFITQNTVISYQMAEGNSAPVSAAGYGRIRYVAAQKFQVSYNGGAYADLATMPSALTSGSVLFANGSNQIAQDNANFFWDDANNRLGVGTATPATSLDIASVFQFNATSKVLFITQSAADPLDGSGAITLRNTLSTSVSQITWRDHSSVFKAALGLSNDSSGTGPNYFYFDNAGKGLLFSGPGGPSVQIYAGVVNQAGVQLHSGGSLAVSAASTGRLRYNSTNQRFQVSENGGSYLFAAIWASTPITGGVLFGNGSDRVAQDSANFYWDDTNNRLGIGNAAPATTLHVTGNSYVDGKAGVGINPTSGTTTLASFRGTTGDTQQIWVALSGIDASTVDTTAAIAVRTGVQASSQASRSAGSNDLYNIGLSANATNGQINYAILTDNGDVALNNGSGITIIGPPGGTGGVLAINGGSAAAVSASDTGRVRYEESIDRLQASVNGGAYADFKFTTTEYLSVDGAADPAIETSFVSGTGTDLTLANGTRGGFIKNFVITGGTGTITPANLADGNVLTWSAIPANVSFIWDATNTTWHVIGSPYNMVTT